MEYKTSDIVLASCLKLNQYKLKTIVIEATGKGVFVFENVDDDFLQKYNLGQVLVEPVIFNNTIRQLTTSVRRLNKKIS